MTREEIIKMIKKIKENWFLWSMVSVIVLIITFNSLLWSEIDKTSTFYKSKLGGEFVLEKDTLTVVDYNSFKGVFILSDGREVSKDLVK